MHMADALITPVVGGSMWVASAGLLAYSSKKIKQEDDDSKVALMGVLGAFVFAAQMINFAIPGTGSSGHIGGGMLLAILLGPYGAFVTIASILTVQALFFADGGLLALGCNIFNLGFFPCFIAYPFIYKKLVGSKLTTGRIYTAAIISSIVGLQLGAFGVVLETILSGRSELPFAKFLLAMQGIHLAIGLVEGLITASVVVLLWNVKPQILQQTTHEPRPIFAYKPALVILGILTVITAGIISWFASSSPDGLEWSIFKTTGHEELVAPASSLQTSLANIQQKTSFLPDYNFSPAAEAAESTTSWPAVDKGTTMAGLTGSIITLAFIILLSLTVKLIKRKQATAG